MILKSTSIPRADTSVPRTRRRRPWRTPAVELVETESAYVLRAELPGLSVDDLEVAINSHMVSIDGGKAEGDEDTPRYHRRVQLPLAVDSDHVRASFKLGVLELDIPKQERQRGAVVAPIRRANRLPMILRENRLPAILRKPIKVLRDIFAP